MAKRVTEAEEEPEELSSSWPAWYYGPNDQAQIFGNEEEVPDGWVDHPAKVNVDEDDEDDGEPDIDVDGLSVEDLQKILIERDIEFNAKWPAKKLAQVLKKAGA